MAMLFLPAECGCKLMRLEGNGKSQKFVDQCPMHAGADFMFAVLLNISERGWLGDDSKSMVDWAVARAQGKEPSMPPMPLMEQSVKEELIITKLVPR